MTCTIVSMAIDFDQFNGRRRFSVLLPASLVFLPTFVLFLFNAPIEKIITIRSSRTDYAQRAMLIRALIRAFLSR